MDGRRETHVFQSDVQHNNPEGELPFFFFIQFPHHILPPFPLSPPATLKPCIQAPAFPFHWLLEDIWTAGALVALLKLSFNCFEKHYRISNIYLKPRFQISLLNIIKKGTFIFFIRYS